MKIICIMPVRSEAWVLGLSLRAVLQWVDEVIVMNHASIDRTGDILNEVAKEFPDRCWWFGRQEADWPEMEHRQILLEAARSRGATHIVTVDADEVLTANLVPKIRELIASTPPSLTLQLPWLCLRDTIYKVHRSGIWGSAFASVAFRDSPELHWSSAERGGYQYHHRHPMGRVLVPYRPFGPRGGGLFHLQFVDDTRLRNKQAAYKMQEVTRWPGRMTAAQINAMYNPAVYGRETWNDVHDLAPVPAEWWEPYGDLLKHLSPADVCWQAAEVKRLYAAHPPETFRGLDLFGVVPDVK